MNKEYSIHLEFCGMDGWEGHRSAALTEVTAFQKDYFTEVATTERGSRWFLAAEQILVRFACVFAFACAMATAIPQAKADSTVRGEWQPHGTSNGKEVIVAVRLLPNHRELRVSIGQDAPDVLLRILVYGSALICVAILIGNCLARERRLVAEIEAGTKPRRHRRRASPAPLFGSSIDRAAPIKMSEPIWQDAQGRMLTVP